MKPTRLVLLCWIIQLNTQPPQRYETHLLVCVCREKASLSRGVGTFFLSLNPTFSSCVLSSRQSSTCCVGADCGCLVWEEVHAIKSQPVITYFCFSFAVSQKEELLQQLQRSALERRGGAWQRREPHHQLSLSFSPLIKKIPLWQVSVNQQFHIKTSVFSALASVATSLTHRNSFLGFFPHTLGYTCCMKSWLLRFPGSTNMTLNDLKWVQQTNEQHANFSNDLLVPSLLCIYISVCHSRING